MVFQRIIKSFIDQTTAMLSAFENRDFLRGMYKYIQNYNSNYITIVKEPKTFDERTAVIKDYPNVGIVFQGPIMKQENFTIETIKLFRTWYPNIKIVLSTWNNMLSKEDINTLTSLNCYIIQSNQFDEEYKGKNEKVGHLNNQIYSSRCGLEYLYNNNVDYAMKIRTDIRLYKVDFIPYLLNLIKIFDKADLQLINVAFSNSLYSIPFHMSDFIWFGKIEQLINLYSIPYRTKKELDSIVKFVESNKFLEYKEKFSIYKDKSFSNETAWYDNSFLNINFLKIYHEEIYLIYQFIAREINIQTSENLLSEYYDFLSRLIIVDDNDLFAYWNKSLYSYIKANFAFNETKKLTHSYWLQIYLKKWS